MCTRKKEVGALGVIASGGALAPSGGRVLHMLVSCCLCKCMRRIPIAVKGAPRYQRGLEGFLLEGPCLSRSVPQFLDTPQGSINAGSPCSFAIPSFRFLYPGTPPIHRAPLLRP